MILVRVELHPAVTGDVREIGRMQIVNDGSSKDRRKGDYVVRLLKRGTKDVAQRRGEVKDHPRLTQSVWRLVAKALDSVEMRP